MEGLSGGAPKSKGSCCSREADVVTQGGGGCCSTRSTPTAATKEKPVVSTPPQATPPQTFYRRALPATCIDFASQEGRLVFAEALARGHLQAYFPLAAQFHTQSDPAFCGLGTLCMVMNALAIDPKRAWKGPWRWFSEEMLDCCTPLEIVQKSGITLPEFICLARCNGANCDANYASSSSIEEFREAVKHCTSQDQQFMVVSYNRQRLGQTGTGHFSPIAGYHPDRDLVLVMDVARFKYPPHWVKLEQLFEALKDLDPVTGLSRGYVLISNGSGPHVFSRIKAGPDLWQDMVRHFFEKIPNLLQKKLIEKGDLSLDEYVAILSNYVTTSTNVTTNFSTYTKDLKERISSEHEALLETLHAEIHSTQLFVLLREFALGSSSLPLKLSSKEKDGSQSVEAKSCCQRALALDSAFLELMTIILYLALSVLEAQEWWKERGLPQALADELASLQRLPSVKNEVDYLRSNLSNFTSFVASGK